MIQITMQFSSIAEALKALGGLPNVDAVTTVKDANPGKSTTGASTAAETTAAPARTPRTAKAAAETAAPVKTDAASSPTAASAGAAPQASTAATEKVEYVDVQKAVAALVKAKGMPAAQEVAKGLGYATFKEIPAEKWGEAIDAVRKATAGE